MGQAPVLAFGAIDLQIMFRGSQPVRRLGNRAKTTDLFLNAYSSSLQWHGVPSHVDMTDIQNIRHKSKSKGEMVALLQRGC